MRTYLDTGGHLRVSFLKYFVSDARVRQLYLHGNK